MVDRDLVLRRLATLDTYLSHELGGLLASMVGFRNILVHDYTRLDPTIVTRVLRTDLDDLAPFRDVVRTLV